MRHAFEAALDDFERSHPETPPPICAFADRVSTLPHAPQPFTGSHSLWELAAAWTPEADPPPPRPAPPPPPPRPSARAEDVAAELSLTALRSSADVARARRRFMWENHPDRRGDLDRDLANRRVAVANMLLDRVLAWHAKRRK
jgi:hypothetical protein